MDVNIVEIENLLAESQSQYRTRLARIDQVIETIGVYNLARLIADHWGLGELTVRRASATVGQGYAQSYGRAYCSWIHVGPAGVSLVRSGTPNRQRQRWIVTARCSRPSDLAQYMVGHVIPSWSRRFGLRWSWWKGPF